ncbi:unnamed protein product [Symbiodinium sp. KB8]|nr:unnamed protein product [Symbiodinium sp. KB8]
MDARSTAAVSALLHFHLWIATRLRPETGRGQPGNSPRPLANAGLLLFQDLKARPRMDCAPKPTLPRLTFSLQCRFCAGKISLEDVDAQWGRPGAEASSKFQCPHCRTESTLKLRVETVATSARYGIEGVGVFDRSCMVGETSARLSPLAFEPTAARLPFPVDAGARGQCVLDRFRPEVAISAPQPD